MAAAATEATLKPRQLQVTRIRREEEEESWISGEELYTEGSSDDESSGQALPTHDTHPSHPPSATSEPAQQDVPHLTETTRRLSLMGLESADAAQKSAGAADADEVEEQEEVMLWRPKRGSIKLPHVELDPPSSSLMEQVSG